MSNAGACFAFLAPRGAEVVSERQPRCDLAHVPEMTPAALSLRQPRRAGRMLLHGVKARLRDVEDVHAAIHHQARLHKLAQQVEIRRIGADDVVVAVAAGIIVIRARPPPFRGLPILIKTQRVLKDVKPFGCHRSKRGAEGL